MIHEGVPREATAYLHHLRAQVLAKAARLA